jgi:PAS domain S-box-containing protein
MATVPAAEPGITVASLPVLLAARADGLGVLLDLALEATAATGAALFTSDGEHLRVLQARGPNAPPVGDPVPLAGTVAGEAWYRSRLVIGAEPPPRGRQAALWQEERTVDVMAVPVLAAERPVAVFMLYHRHLGHFRRSDASTLSRLATLAAGLWASGEEGSPGQVSRAQLEVRAAARMALVASGHFEEEEAWVEVARTAATLLESPSARVSLVDGEELVCHASTGRFSADLGRRRPLAYGFEGVAYDTVEGVLASDWAAEASAPGSNEWIRSMVAVPLRRVEQVVGVLTVADEAPGRFSDADREALLRFGMHATAALTELRLHAAAARHLTGGRLATQIAAAFAAAEDTPALRRSIAGEIARALDAEGARLSEIVQRRPAVTATHGDLPILDQPPFPGRQLLCGHVMPADETAHRCTLPDGSGFLLAMTLGQVTAHPGCLQLIRQSRPFVRHEEELLHRLLEIAELALLTRLANVRVSQYADRIRSVAEVTASLHQSLRPADAMGQAAEMLRRALGAGTVRIALVDEVWRELSFAVHRSGEQVLDGSRRALGNGVLEEVWRTGRTWFLAQNAAAEAKAAGLALDSAARSFAAAPLRTRGTVTGIIVIEDETEDGAFEAEDVRILEIVTQQLGVTLENLESLEEERRQRITAEWLRQMARTATDPEAGPPAIFELAADAAFHGIGGTSSLVGFLAEGEWTTMACRGAPPADAQAPRPAAATVAGWMLGQQGAVFITADATADGRLGPECRDWLGGSAVIAVPIWGDNRIAAVLELRRVAGASFTVAEVERLAQIADHAGSGYQTALAAEALRKSEDRYRRLFSGASEAIFTLDRDGLLTSLNAAAEQLWQVSASGSVGRRWDAVLPLEGSALVEEEIRRALAGASCALEVTFRGRDGERGVVAMTISPLVEGGETTAVLGIVRDVTDQRRVQSQLLQAEKMSAIGQLVGGMAHEINNPLASILVNMELLLTETSDPAQLETLQAVKAETDRAAQIVRNLLTYIRGQGSDRTAIDLRDPVRGALALRRNQLLHWRIAVEVDLPDTPVVVWGNTVNLQQVLMNLLTNAEHAIRGHRGQGRVWVRLATVAGRAVITVDDDGPGVPPELLTRIFDPFYTTKPEGEGTGLGLSVSAGIVADHGGKVSALPRPDGGARFQVELPLHTAGPLEQPGQPAPPVAGPAAHLSRGTILLVDDEPDIRRSISKFLTRSGWSVDLADSGAEGLRLLESGDYAAVLCDLRMPGMSGHEFYRQLQTRHSPVIDKLIIMTGDVVSPEASRFLQEAGRPVLSKPFTLTDLMAVLATVVPR